MHDRQPFRLKVLPGFCPLLFLFGAIISACQLASSPPPTSSRAPITLRLALLPILDALPIYVADQEGYFTANGVKVSYVPVASAAERDQVMAANQADVMINDLVAVTLYNRDAVQVQVVRFAQVATHQQALYRILASPGSKVTSPAGLKGVDIAISKASVIEYVTERLLQASGLAPGDIRTTVVPKIPDRLALLSSGKLGAATLPEPFSTLAVQAGCRVLLDDTSHPEYGSSVLSFRKTVIDQHPAAVAGFLKAVDQAVADINRDHTKWSGLLQKYNLVPQALVASYPVPSYPTQSLPTEAQFKDVVDWAMAKGMITKPVSYADSVNPGPGSGK